MLKVLPGDLFRVGEGTTLFVSDLFTGQTRMLFGRGILLLVISNAGSDVTMLAQGLLCHLTSSELWSTKKLSE